MVTYIYHIEKGKGKGSFEQLFYVKKSKSLQNVFQALLQRFLRRMLKKNIKSLNNQDSKKSNKITLSCLP